MERRFGKRRFVTERIEGAVRLEWFAPRGRGWTVYLWHPRRWTGIYWKRDERRGWNLDLGPVEIFWR